MSGKWFGWDENFASFWTKLMMSLQNLIQSGNFELMILNHESWMMKTFLFRSFVCSLGVSVELIDWDSADDSRSNSFKSISSSISSSANVFKKSLDGLFLKIHVQNLNPLWVRDPNFGSGQPKFSTLVLLWVYEHGNNMTHLIYTMWQSHQSIIIYLTKEVRSSSTWSHVCF